MAPLPVSFVHCIKLKHLTFSFMFRIDSEGPVKNILCSKYVIPSIFFCLWHSYWDLRKIFKRVHHWNWKQAPALTQLVAESWGPKEIYHIRRHDVFLACRVDSHHWTEVSILSFVWVTKWQCLELLPPRSASTDSYCLPEEDIKRASLFGNHHSICSAGPRLCTLSCG